VQAGDAARERQPESAAAAAARRVEPREAVEDPIPRLPGNARARVVDVDDGAAGRPGRADLDHVSAADAMKRIVEQVHQHPVDQGSIGMDDSSAGLDAQLDAAFLEGGRIHVCGPEDPGVEIHRAALQLEVCIVDLGEQQQRVDDSGDLLAGLANRVERADEFVRVVAQQRHLGHRPDPVDGRAQLVGDVAAEGSDASERGVDARQHAVQSLGVAVDRIAAAVGRDPVPEVPSVDLPEDSRGVADRPEGSRGRPDADGQGDQPRHDADQEQPRDDLARFVRLVCEGQRQLQLAAVRERRLPHQVTVAPQQVEVAQAPVIVPGDRVDGSIGGRPGSEGFDVRGPGAVDPNRRRRAGERAAQVRNGLLQGRATSLGDPHQPERVLHPAVAFLEALHGDEGGQGEALDRDGQQQDRGHRKRGPDVHPSEQPADGLR